MSEVNPELPEMCCPSCTNLGPTKIVRRYRSALSAERIVLECPRCNCAWTEFADDVFPEKDEEVKPCPLLS